MFDFLPVWFKALVGCGVMLFIGIAGFSLTTKGGKSGGGGAAPAKKEGDK